MKTQKQKKSRRKKLLIWLAVDAIVAVAIFGSLLYTPSQYKPAVPPPADESSDGEPMHPYLSHELMPTLYNGAQEQRPFEMVVLDEALNEAIARMQWPQQAQGITLTAPAVLFVPGRVVLMGTANIEGANLVVTIEIGPEMDDRGYLNLNVAKVKVGAMNVTPLARTIARKEYQERLEMGPIDIEDLGTKIAASLLNQEPFDPVFEVEDKWVRLTDVEITDGKLLAKFAPAGDRTEARRQ
mgnify:CR=1 FL=1